MNTNSEMQVLEPEERKTTGRAENTEPRISDMPTGDALKARTDEFAELNYIEIEEQRQTIQGIEIPQIQDKKERKVLEGKNKLIKAFEKIIPKFFKIEVIGAENLAKISDDENVVITTTHITDPDLPIALAGIGRASTENSRFGQTKLIQMAGNLNNTFFKNVVKATGSENWLTISVFGDADNRVNKYSPNDFKQIEEALERGYPVTIAESLDPKSDGWNLSKKVGNGAARLALAGNVIIPVAVEIDEKLPMQAAFSDQVLALWKVFRRPKAKIIIGEPIRVQRNDNVADIDRILEKRSAGETVTKDDLEKFRSARKDLKDTSVQIKYAIADLLSEDRRGPWNRKKKIFQK